LQRLFAEYVGDNRSRLVQFIFKRFHRLNMAGKLPASAEVEQGINQAILSQEITTFNNLSQSSTAPQALEEARCSGPKPLTRPTRSPRALRVSRRVAVWGTDKAWGTSFPLKSTKLQGIA
jgi:hypothetical protein